MRRQLLGSAAVVLLLATGCSGGKATSSSPPASVTRSASVSATPTPSLTTSAKPTGKAKPVAGGCDAVVKATGAKLQNGTIRETDVLDTFNACGTMADFSKATINSPGLVDLSSTDALTFVKKACGANANLRVSKLCKAVGATAAAPSSSSGL